MPGLYPLWLNLDSGGGGRTVYVDRLADVNTLEFEAAEGLGLGGGEELELGASDTVALELGTDLALDGDGDLEIS